MLFSSPSGLWILYGKLLQIFSPQFKEFGRAYKCHCEAQSPGDRLIVEACSLDDPRFTGYRAESEVDTELEVKFKYVSLIQGVAGGMCSPQPKRCVMFVSFHMCPDFSIFLHRKKMITSTFPRKTLKLPLFYGKNKSLNCSFENITRNQDLTTIFCKIKHITAANSIATSSKSPRKPPDSPTSGQFHLIWGDSDSLPWTMPVPDLLIRGVSFRARDFQLQTLRTSCGEILLQWKRVRESFWT